MLQTNEDKEYFRESMPGVYIMNELLDDAFANPKTKNLLINFAAESKKKGKPTFGVDYKMSDIETAKFNKDEACQSMRIYLSSYVSEFVAKLVFSLNMSFDKIAKTLTNGQFITWNSYITKQIESYIEETTAALIGHGIDFYMNRIGEKRELHIAKTLRKIYNYVLQNAEP
jgi:hypothetical protein